MKDKIVYIDKLLKNLKDNVEGFLSIKILMRIFKDSLMQFDPQYSGVAQGTQENEVEMKQIGVKDKEQDQEN